MLAAVLLAAAALVATPAAAQQPELSFVAGRVTITARDTPLEAILDAWQLRGGTQFVHAGRLPAATVSIRLVDVPEREALRVLLRAAGGYVAIPRDVGPPGESAFERIFVMGAGHRRPGPGRAAADDTASPTPAPGDRFGATPEPHDAAAMEEVDELELVETLRRRYQDATTPDSADAPGRFGPAPAGEPAGTASRPGIIVAPEPESSADAPRPPRRRPR